MRTHTRWVIVGRGGLLYVDQHLTRRDMIAHHVHDVETDNFGRRISKFTNGALDIFQAAAWKRCQDRGDRCVKATITVQED